MKILRRSAVLLIGPAALLVIAARLQPAAGAQSGQFPTVPPPNVTFPSPLVPVGTAVPAFGAIDSQPEHDLVGRLEDAAGYLAGGVLGLAIGGVAYWLSRRVERGPGLLKPGGAGGSRLGPGRTAFRSRLRRIAWLAPSAAGLAFLVVAGSKCVPSKVCYANAGGVQVVVPCEEAEGQAEAQVTPTATPFIDCSDPGRGGTNAYEIAKAGGAHSGYLRQAEGYPDTSLLGALRSYELQVTLHDGKIANPAAQALDTPWDSMDSDEQRRVLTDWCGDLRRNRELADVILGLLHERGINP